MNDIDMRNNCTEEVAVNAKDNIKAMVSNFFGKIAVMGLAPQRKYWHLI